MRLVARLSLVLLAGPALSVGTTPAGAQDVEALGARYGTLPPAAYYETMRADRDAYSFNRGRAARMRARMAAEAAADPGRPLVLGPREGPVTGSFRVPVVLGLFSDSPAADSMRFGGDEVADAYFGGGPGTITDFYDEISLGKVELLGDVRDWTRVSFTQAQAAGGTSGLTTGTTGSFILQILARLPDVDWGLYDNDGPDGVPNSGDDDGYVDALAVIHPTSGAECGGTNRENRIWSHRWSLRFSAGQTYTSTVPSANGGFIRVDDYIIQPLFACNGNDQSEIGVFAHELGHAFGLPDLYDTRGKHAGAGSWDLMSSGSWGCSGSTPESPCHMGAWSKATLGWVDVVTLAPDADHGTLTIPPVETSGTVYRVDAGDGSGEYFLLENRQRIGFDQHLFGEGLLVWHVDPDWIANNWRSNTVNAGSHRGVWLRQADGRDDLGTAGRGRGDADDPFPWIGLTQENRSFHAASRPAATSQLGTPTGLTIIDVARIGDDIELRLLTSFTRLTMRAEGGLGNDGVFTVNGSAVAGITHSFTSAPFVAHDFEAVAGEPIEPGVRRPFTGWDDDASSPARRRVVTPLVDTDYVARYDGRQVQLAMTASGGVNNVEPGGFQSNPASPDLWFTEGASVSIEAVPTTGFAFSAWTGALAGQPNPASLVMAGPVDAGAVFELTYGLPSTPVSFSAASVQQLFLLAENATAPVVWLRLDGAFPEGILVDPFGKVTGAALETGSFPVTMRATDARGLVAEGTIVFDVAAPAIGVDQLASAFFGVGPALDVPQTDFLDYHGNRNGGYDLGDFRAWALANPDLPFTAPMRALIGPTTIVVPMRPVVGNRPEGGR